MPIDPPNEIKDEIKDIDNLLAEIKYQPEGQWPQLVASALKRIESLNHWTQSQEGLSHECERLKLIAGNMANDLKNQQLSYPMWSLRSDASQLHTVSPHGCPIKKSHVVPSAARNLRQ